MLETLVSLRSKFPKISFQKIQDSVHIRIMEQSNNLTPSVDKDEPPFDQIDNPGDCSNYQYQSLI